MSKIEKFYKIALIVYVILYVAVCTLSWFSPSCRGIAFNGSGQFAVAMSKFGGSNVYFYNENMELVRSISLIRTVDIYFDFNLIYIEDGVDGQYFYDYNGNELDKPDNFQDVSEYLKHMNKGTTAVNTENLTIQYNQFTERIIVENKAGKKEIQYGKYMFKKMTIGLQPLLILAFCIFVMIYNKLAKEKINFKLY